MRNNYFSNNIYITKAKKKKKHLCNNKPYNVLNNCKFDIHTGLFFSLTHSLSLSVKRNCNRIERLLQK